MLPKPLPVYEEPMFRERMLCLFFTFLFWVVLFVTYRGQLLGWMGRRG